MENAEVVVVNRVRHGDEGGVTSSSRRTGDTIATLVK
jgi:hypothetical protein